MHPKPKLPYRDHHGCTRRGTGGYGSTYYLEWYGSGIPHLEWIANGVGTPENYTFSTTSQSLWIPSRRPASAAQPFCSR